jgi:flagellar biosynthesis anti-sigma factor FlgM
MDIRSSLEGLKSIFGAGQAPAVTPQARPGAQAGSTALGSDRASFSNAASEAAQSVNDSGVRLDKVASIQSQLAAGTYSVPSSAVASKVIESMLA